MTVGAGGNRNKLQVLRSASSMGGDGGDGVWAQSISKVEPRSKPALVHPEPVQE